MNEPIRTLVCFESTGALANCFVKLGHEVTKA